MLQHGFAIFDGASLDSAFLVVVDAEAEHPLQDLVVVDGEERLAAAAASRAVDRPVFTLRAPRVLYMQVVQLIHEVGPVADGLLGDGLADRSAPVRPVEVYI